MEVAAKIAVVLALAGCNGTVPAQVQRTPVQEMEGYANATVQTGAQRTGRYLPLLAGKKVAVVTNQTGMIGATHLVDSLLASGVKVAKVFAPEHGFRGEASAGEHVADERDKRTGLPVVSLYGKNKKPSPAQLADVDILLFDIQDVGVRFYTYISTLHYVMEAAAEQGKQVIVLDRPNPNGFYVDGPVLDTAFRSFVGMHPVPLVHGLTIAEYAQMINGQGWLKGGAQCDLTVIPCTGYDHATFYALPVRPSPNLPNMAAVYLYPSLGLFEGTIVSVGRGTGKPFQCIGFPGCTLGDFTFTPRTMAGAAKPPYEGQSCTGLDLSSYGDFYSRLDPGLKLEWLIGMYNASPDKAKFFNPFFDKLAGNTSLRKAVQAGKSEDAIRAGWKKDIEAFKLRSKPYLLYPVPPASSR
ncbi:MAG TPA: DUF1343 domain-containing protein [Flavobacteriales bacterium]|nr:DUF1343 domain-containing protein [Flavobacteriales bacterium]